LYIGFHAVFKSTPDPCSAATGAGKAIFSSLGATTTPVRSAETNPGPELVGMDVETLVEFAPSDKMAAVAGMGRKTGSEPAAGWANPEAGALVFAAAGLAGGSPLPSPSANAKPGTALPQHIATNT
jgi:hypothetical protein